MGGGEASGARGGRAAAQAAGRPRRALRRADLGHARSGRRGLGAADRPPEIWRPAPPGQLPRARRRVARLRCRALLRRIARSARLGRGRRRAWRDHAGGRPARKRAATRGARRLRRHRGPRWASHRGAFLAGRLVGGVDGASLRARSRRKRASCGDGRRPAEDRGFAWVEVVAVDVDGAPVGSPRRLTSVSGSCGVVRPRDAASRRARRRRQVRDETQAREGGASFTSSSVPTAESRSPRSSSPWRAGRGSVDSVSGDGDYAGSLFPTRRTTPRLCASAGATAIPPLVYSSLEGALGRRADIDPGRRSRTS